MLNETLGDGLESLLLRLAEAILWCGSPRPYKGPTDPAGHLRTPRLAPYAFEVWGGGIQGQVAVVRSVADARRRALGRPATAPAADLAGGRLLAFAPDDNLTDLAAEVATGGYFDSYNVPPWDTWVGYACEPGRQYLVSWVPPVSVSTAEAGVLVNPERCLWWVDEEKGGLATLLRSRGFFTKPAGFGRTDYSGREPLWDADLDG